MSNEHNHGLTTTGLEGDTGNSALSGFMSLLSPSGVSYIDAMLFGYSFSGVAGKSAKIDYTFIVDGNSILNINPNYKDLVGKAFGEWGSVANIGFDYKLPSKLNTDLNGTRALIFMRGDLGDGLGYGPPIKFDGTNADKLTNASVTLSSTLISDSDLKVGEVGYFTVLHEIGHTLGLKHPSDGTSGTGEVLPDAEQNWDASVMATPYPSVGPNTSLDRQPAGPMIYDIAAIQYLYGANHSYNSGNTTIRADGSSYAKAIWDGGGIDTLDQSTSTSDVLLDLREGYSNVSAIGETRLWMAFGSNIENAYGGSGNDDIFGNDGGNMLYGFSGNDSLDGGAGGDDINGNIGADTVSGGSGADILRGGKDDDIVQGGDDGDWINGNFGSDIVLADNGNDTLRGGAGDDVLFGGIGNDVIYGDLGNDRMNGGAGSDIFIFSANGGFDVVEDFSSVFDLLRFTSDVGVSVSNVISHTSYSGGDAVISLSNLTVVLSNVSNIAADDIQII